MVFGPTDETNYIQTRMDYQKIGDLGVILSPLMTYLQVTLSMDDTYYQTTRQAQTFIMALSASGGFNNVVLAVAIVLLQRIQAINYYTSLIQSLFFVQPGGTTPISTQTGKEGLAESITD